MKHIAIYARVSSKKQDTRSQDVELKAWAATQTDPVKWYTDKATGTNFNRPGWESLWKDIQAGTVSKVIVWRLDRLGRTVGPLATILDDLEARKVGFYSLKDGFDSSTPAGRLCRNVLASVAQFETEVRSERQRAGIDAVQDMIAKGIPRKTRSGIVRTDWGGGAPAGYIRKLTPEVVATAKDMKAQGKSIAEIARVLKLTRKTVYSALER